MARGKHAVKAARGQVEARDELIDRLTDQLAEAKQRARMVEEDARRLPATEAEVRNLRQQAAEQSFPAVVELHQKIEALKVEHRSALDAACALMWEAVKNVGGTLRPQDYDRLRDVFGAEALALGIGATSRTARRNLASKPMSVHMNLLAEERV